MDEQKSKIVIPKKIRVDVRMTESEYIRLFNDAKVLGTSMQAALKRRYFSGPEVKPLMAQDDVSKVNTSLARIGNNINQIARRVNMDIRVGVHDEVSELAQDLKKLRDFLTTKYCNCRLVGSKG